MDRVRYHLDLPPAPARDIKGIGDILPDVVEGLERPQSDGLLVLRDAWAGLVGPQIAAHSQPSFVKDFELHVVVDHPGWLPELERSRRPLLQKIKATYRSLGIRRLRFVLKHR